MDAEARASPPMTAPPSATAQADRLTSTRASAASAAGSGAAASRSSGPVSTRWARGFRRTAHAVRRNPLTLSLIEARPQVQLAFALRFSCGAVLAGDARYGGGFPLARFACGLAVWQCAVVAVYLCNGVVDVTGDRVNGSRRPIAGGDLSPRLATCFTAGFAVVALASAAAIGLGFFAGTAAFLALGAVYSLPPFDVRKRFLGATIVTTAAGLLTYAAGASLDRGLGRPVLLTAAVMAAWMGLIGATTKDFGDSPGDREAGRHTLFGVLGDTGLRRLVALSALVVAGSFVVGASLVAATVVPAAVVMLVGAAVLARHAVHGSVTTCDLADRRARDRLRVPYQIFMATQLATHVAVLVSVAGVTALSGRSP